MQDEPSVWSEPVPVGQEGAHCLILQTSDHAAYDDVHVVSLPSRNKGRKQVVLWVVVEVQGLEKRITLQGGYQLKNYMPMPIECRFSSEEILPPEDGSRSQKDAAMARTRVQNGPCFRLDVTKPTIDLNSPSQDVVGKSLMMDEVGDDGRVRIRVEVRRADVAENDDEDYCEAVVLDLPTSQGAVCQVSMEAAMQAPWAMTHLRQCSTAPGSMASPRTTWFLLRIRRIPVVTRVEATDVVKPLKWAWVSIEVWPALYLVSSACRSRFRLASGEGFCSASSNTADEQGHTSGSRRSCLSSSAGNGKTG